MSETNTAVFLSYASQDAESARRIAEALRVAGVEVWFDQNELRGGEVWDARIRKQIRECALFVPLISAHTQARLEGYFRREWKLAIDRTHDMAEEKAFLLPVAIDDTTEGAAGVPEKFREVQWLRAVGESGLSVLAERVLALLGGTDGPVPKRESELHLRAREYAQRQGAGFLAIVCVDSGGGARAAGTTETNAAVGARPEAEVRELLARFAPAEVIGGEGHRVFLAFTESATAVKFALLLHLRLRKRAKDTSAPTAVRMAVHADEVALEESSAASRRLAGPGAIVDRTARLAGLGQTGQVLLTRRVFDDARQALEGQDLEGMASLSWVSHGHYTLAGDDQPVEICEVAELLAGPPAPPPGTKGSRRVVPPEHEPVLGWRPALGQMVPDTLWMLEKKLGEGGFGEVWLGRHQTMKERRVFKFCFHAERARSLKRELTLFRVLKESVGDHPNIVRLLEVHFSEPPIYVEMDFVDGQSLKPWCEQHGGIDKIPLADRLEIVAQIAEALQAAHEAGVIHRDVKPGNILVSQSATPGARPRAKLTDFGIGQVLSDEVLQGVTKAGFTVSVLAESSSAHSGTQLYMAPELFAGEHASPRSDIYSLGVVLYQLVIGDLRRPVTTDWAKAIADPVLCEDLARCFAGKPEERFSRAGELAERLRAMEPRRAALAKEQAAAAAKARSTRRWKLAWTAGLAAVVAGLGASTAWFLQRNAELRWAREVALPEIQKLVEKFDYFAAYNLAVQVEKYLPTDPALTSLWPKISAKANIETTPPGADIYYKEYRKPETAWRPLGKSPVKDVRMARVVYRWQIKKEGFALVESAGGVGGKTHYSLDRADVVPAGMIRVPRNLAFKGSFESSTGLEYKQLGDYLIDRCEVSNRQFQEFVDRGGYSNRSYWKQPFARQNAELSWEEALDGFRDTTGKPGPATWVNGAFPEGKGDHPVTGVSWFEAAAYAEFAGKRLPSIYHWRWPGFLRGSESIVRLSNFDGHGTAPVGHFQGMSQWGAYDMAGNAKEWCWNEAQPGTRYILGGGVGEPVYMYTDLDALSAFERSPLHGFRCIKLLSLDQLDKAVDAAYVRKSRNYAQEQPVSEAEFRTYRLLYSYDKSALDSQVEAVNTADARWRMERISFNAAYNNERMSALVFLPKNHPPPHQTVVYFPTADVQRAGSSDRLGGDEVRDLIIEHGRAWIFPIYKGTFERAAAPWKAPRVGTIDQRDWLIQVSKDLGRTIDYLETRSDIRSDKLAYLGRSWGASFGAMFPALESRLKVVILLNGGLFQTRFQPEADPFNFAPRITAPTLMVNGRADFLFPLETSQLPLYRALGASPAHKRQALFDTGHGGVALDLFGPEILGWLDKYLGPVKK